MWEGPIVKKINSFREEHAQKFSFDLQVIYNDLKEQEKKRGGKVISLPIQRRHFEEVNH